MIDRRLGPPSHGQLPLNGCIAFLAMATAALGWGSKAPPSLARPVGSAATFVESYSPTEVVVQATGVGSSPDAAEADIPLVAIQFVLFRWDGRLVSTADEESRALPLLDSIYGHADRFVSWKASRASSTQKVGSTFQITRAVRILKSDLLAALERGGAVATREKLARGVGNPEIAVMPQVAQGADPVKVLDGNLLAKTCQASIKSYLEQRQYRVKDLRRQAEITAHRQTKGESMPELSASSILRNVADADIYIQFDVRIATVADGQKVTLMVAAVDATTMEGIGTELGYSRARFGASEEALVEEAAHDAIDKVLQQVNNYWKRATTDGLTYKIAIAYPESLDPDRKFEVSEAIRSYFQDHFVESKQDATEDTRDEYTVRAASTAYRDAPSIFAAIRKEVVVEGIGFKRSPSNRRMINIEVLEK